MNTSYRKITILSLFILSFFSAPINSLELKTQENINLDTSIIRSDLSYNIPEQIVIAPIFINAETAKLDSTSKYRGLYYYLIQKLGFSDIPFHYVISEDGEIFEGNSGGDERKVQVDGLGNNIILIGYLGGTLKTAFDPRSLNSFSELLLDVSNKNSITTDKIKVSNIKFVRDISARSVLMKSADTNGSWQESLTGIINSFKDKYSPTTKTYSAQAEITEISKEEVEPGSEQTVSIKIKNVGKNGMYGGSTSGLLLSKQDGSTSKFFLNNEWVSKSQIEIMSSGQNLFPNQEDTFEFKLRAPLNYGETTELFELKTIKGATVESESISLTLKMKRGDKKIVEIKNTELGYLKVRAEPSTLGSEIGRVSTGERFFVLEDAGNGYYKIETADGQSGWIAGWFTTSI